MRFRFVVVWVIGCGLLSFYEYATKTSHPQHGTGLPLPSAEEQVPHTCDAHRLRGDSNDGVIYVAEDRAATSHPEAEEAGPLTFSVVKVKPYLDGRPERLRQPSRDMDIPSTISIVNMPISAWLRALVDDTRAGGKPADGKTLVIYVHGLNTGLHEAICRTQHIRDTLGWDTTVLLFSWPSGHDVGWNPYSVYTTYRHAETLVVDSAVAFRRVLVEIQTLIHPEQIVLIGYSLGSRVVEEALRLSEREAPANSSAYRAVVLIAPDIAQEDFRQRTMPLLSAMATRAVLCFNKSDLALFVSKWINGGRGRAGAEPIEASGLESIDIAATPGYGPDWISHSDHWMYGALGELWKRLLPQRIAAAKRP